MAEPGKDIVNNLRAPFQESSVPPSTKRSRRKTKSDDEEAETSFKWSAEIHQPQKVTRRSPEDLTGEGPAPSRTDGGITGLTSATKRKREASDAEAEAGAARPAKVTRQAPPPSTSDGDEEAEEREEGWDIFDWWQLAKVPEPGDAEDLEMKYEQRSPLGEGGFGSVFAGVRRSDQLPVAIKRIQRADVMFGSGTSFNGEEVTLPIEVILMFNAGSGAVGCDPSVALLDWFCLAEDLVLVMERPTPSQDLFHYCEEYGPLSEEFAKELTIQLVRALSDLHQNRVFHSDIKVENLLFQHTETGPRVRIIDFGCGCQVTTAPYSSFSGTGDYEPPESVLGGQYRAGPASVWQIGCTLLVMLDLDPEFSTRSCIQGNLKLPEGLSQGCKDFIRDCLKLKPELRPALETLALHPWLNS